MNTSAILVAVCGLIYLGISIDQLVKGQPWISLMYFAYALGNVAAYMMVVKGLKP
jgi:hypothetical protein